MHRSFIWLSIICVLCFVSCSKSAAPRDQDASASAVLNSDSGYIFLLEEPASPPGPAQAQLENNIYTVIAGADIEKYSAYRSGCISRYDDFAALTADNEARVVHPGDGMTYTFSASDGSADTRLHFGMSKSGTDIYHLGIVPGDAEGDAAFHVRLAHFDAVANRVIEEIDLVSFDADTFLANRELIDSALSEPVYVSANGSTVIVRATRSDMTEDASGAALELVSEGMLNSLSGRCVYYRYDFSDNSVEPWLNPSAGFPSLSQVGISDNGARSLFTAGSYDGDELLILYDDEDDEPVIVIESEPGGIFRPRLSPEGSRVGYFREPVNSDERIIEAVMVPMFSKSRHVYLRLAGVDDYCWTDDLKRVAYISHAFGSSLVIDNKIPRLTSSGRIYLHLVDIDTLDDKVIFGGSTGEALRITDVLAEGEDFKSDDSPEGRVRKGTPSPDSQHRGHKHSGGATQTEEGPSITG